MSNSGGPAPQGRTRTVALVPARGGSKSIPHKNIRLLAGRPLLYWVCLAAERCEHVDATYVATDDDLIAQTAAGLGLPKVRVIGRAPETATDTASTESAMLDFAARVDFDNILLLQATSPLTDSRDLDRAFQLFQDGRGCDSVLSVVRERRFFWKSGPDHRVEPLNYDPRRRPRRQDHPGWLAENGALYLTSRSRLLESGCRLSGSVAAVEMAPETFVELDEPGDWEFVEHLIRRQERQGKTPAAIRLVATDVDGVLTDSGMYYTEAGDELKKFNTRDGKGFELLRHAGVLTCIITAENSRSVERRAAKLKVSDTHVGIEDKVACMSTILAAHGLDWSEVAYIGDDLGDLELLKRVGFSGAPADAVQTVRTVTDVVTEARGGRGAFREFAERILRDIAPPA